MSASLHTRLVRFRAGRMADWFVLFLVGMAAVAAPLSSARSDETYFCDGGRMVTVRFGELEKLARTDPCIAEHLSRRKGHPMASQRLAGVAPAGASQTVQEVSVPLPVRKPVLRHAATSGQSDSAQAAMAAARQLAKQGGNDIIVVHEAPPPSAGAHNGIAPRKTPVVFHHAAHHYYSNEPLPKGPADFRNVPIINAAPGAPAVFHHAR